MAAITPTAFNGRFKVLQSAVTGTTTDWIYTPAKSGICVVHLDISAAGTNTILVLKAASPFTRGAPDDTRAISFFTSATITAASYHSYALGTQHTSVADAAGASTMVVVPANIPLLLGITTTPTGSTYSTAVSFREV